jgi:single-strand DNA-binding protein
MNLNKVFVLGNVTRDPEMRALPSGQQVASFGIATNRFYTDQSGQKKQEAEFHNIVAFGKLADIAQRFLTKGGLVLIEGRIKTSSWQGNDGIKKYRTEIIAESLQLGPRSAGGASQEMSGGYKKPSSSFENNAPKADDIPIIEENTPPSSFVSNDTPPMDDNGEIDVKDIPF